MRDVTVDEPNSNLQRYANCMDSLWEPFGEPHSWVEKEACIFSWLDEPEDPTIGAYLWRKQNVFGVQVEIKICILLSAKAHIIEYIAMQSEAIDDERLQAALNSST